MHLGDRGGRERFGVEGGEQLFRFGSQLGDDELTDRCGVRGWDAIQQPTELPRQRLTEGTRAGGDDLTELDVGGPQIGEGLRELGDELLFEAALLGELAQHTSGGAGDLPAGGAQPCSLGE
ncbi:Uncharacterised protein [Mycobacteroides abscessus]|nr:Uncharacterised protein [Mycobacteroides abscessus]